MSPGGRGKGQGRRDMTGKQGRWQETQREERWTLAGRRGPEPRAEVPHGPAPEVQPRFGYPGSFATAPPSSPGGGDGEPRRGRERVSRNSSTFGRARRRRRHRSRWGKLRPGKGAGGSPCSGRRRGRVQSPAGWPSRPPRLLRSLPRASRGRDGGLEPGRAPACPPPAPVQPRARRAYLSAGTRGPWAAGGRLRGAPGWLQRSVAAEQENL